MALPWFKVESRLMHHPKLRALGLPTDPLGVVIRLWAWTADYCPDGLIPTALMDSAAEAASAGIDKDSEEGSGVTLRAVTDALVSAGFMESVAGGFVVHDWDEMQSAHRLAMESNRERQRRYRERNVTRPKAVTSPRNTEVTPESRVDESRVEVQKQEPRAREAPRTVVRPTQHALTQEPFARSIAFLRSLWTEHCLAATGKPYPWMLRDDEHALVIAQACGHDQATMGALFAAAGRDGWLRSRLVPKLVAQKCGELLLKLPKAPEPPVPEEPLTPEQQAAMATEDAAFKARYTPGTPEYEKRRQEQAEAMAAARARERGGAMPGGSP